MKTAVQTNKKPNLLVAEDEVEIADIIEAVAEDLGFDVQCVYEGAQVVALVKKTTPDLIALDLRMPGADGVEIIRELAKINCRAKIVLMSGMDQRTLSSVQTLGKQQKLDIIATLTKPMSLDAIEKIFSAHNKAVEAPAQPATRVVHPGITAFGLNMLYEPEVELVSDQPRDHSRLSIHMQWRKDNGDILAGEQLVSWAQGLGIARGLEDWLLRDAFETWQSWRISKFQPEISIKLDAFLLQDLEVPDVLAYLTDFYKVDRNKVIIEIDQPAIMSDQSRVSDIMSRLRIKGFRVAICLDGDGEDFIPMLDRLPVDDIVLNMRALPDKAAANSNMELEFVYSSLTTLARKKGLGVTACNVSRPDLLAFVRRCGFTRARGPSISNKLSPEDVIDFYSNEKSQQLDS